MNEYYVICRSEHRGAFKVMKMKAPRLSLESKIRNKGYIVSIIFNVNSLGEIRLLSDSEFRGKFGVSETILSFIKKSDFDALGIPSFRMDELKDIREPI